MTIVQTASGLQVDLLNPDPQSIRLRDIALHLACLARFNGATELGPYSVAQHSCVAARIAADRRYPPLTCLQVLLHDAHEAFTGDITSPVQDAIVGVGDSTLDQVQEMLDEAIYSALGVPMPADRTALAIIAECDEAAFITEWRDLMKGPAPRMPLNTAPGRFVVRPLNWSRAEALFLTEFERLSIAAGIAPTPATER